MKPLKPGRKIILLVWVLVMIGLLAGVLTNGLVGWTLHGLNRERQKLAEQEARLSRGAEQLRRLSRQAQTALNELLQLDLGPVREPFPENDLVQLQEELRNTPGIADLKQVSSALEQRIYQLRRIWRRAVSWRAGYRPVYLDNRDRQTLAQVRRQLQRLRADLEIFEGRKRLKEALTIRRWRTADSREADRLARELLSYRNQSWRRSLDGINTELVDLSRMVEILAGEDRLDQLADLKDNQLKPSLERLAREIRRLRAAGQLAPDELPSRVIMALNEALFGRGFTVYEQYQTIRPGKGGLYLLVQRRLQLLQQRERLQAEAQRELQQLEALYPPLASLTQQRNRELARQADRSLTNGALDLFMLSLLTLVGFLGLGFLIIRMTRHQLAAMARLRRQNELILTSAGEGVLGLDRRGKAIFINPAGARQLGWEQEDLVGLDYRQILRCGEGADASADPISGTLKQGLCHRSDEEQFRRRDGSLIPVACAVTPLQDESRQIEGAVVTFMDISDRKAAEKTLRRYYDRLAEQEHALAELNKDLEQKVAERTRLLEEKSRELMAAQEELAHAEKLAAIGSLAAGVAHEINNPAAIIRGNVEILETTLPAGSEAREETGEILRQVERISLITGNLLAFARKQNLRYAEFSPNLLLSEILDQIGHHVPVDGVDVRFEPAGGLPPCRGDAERLRQVFINLIVNALQAMAGSGVLRVATLLDGDSLLVVIADSGPGIPEEIRGQIFNPFFTTKAAGTGLGLSVSYGIVQAHDGTIEVESRDGCGSTFRVRLPVGAEPV